MEINRVFLKELKTRLLDDPAMPVLGIEPKECNQHTVSYLYTYVYGITIHNSQAMESALGVHQTMNG
jgi:hypothetical protein